MNERTNAIGMETGCGWSLGWSAGQSVVVVVVVSESTWKRADAVSTR